MITQEYAVYTYYLLFTWDLRHIRIYNFIIHLLGRHLDNRIVGGTSARDGQYPYLVSIRNRGVHDCGGAIIDEYWILTAAHCLTS